MVVSFNKESEVVAQQDWSIVKAEVVAVELDEIFIRLYDYVLLTSKPNKDYAVLIVLKRKLSADIAIESSIVEAVK